VTGESPPGLPTLLLVDDDEVFRGALASALQRRGYDVTAVADGTSALEVAVSRTFELALVDVRMPGMDGIELVGRLAAIDDGTRIVVLTGYGSIAGAVAAMRRGAADYLTKPVDADACDRALRGVGGGAPGDAAEVPTVDRVEYEHLQRVLADCSGNVSEAARRLGMHRRTLQRKLARHVPRR
jgi:two-component system response regulator RegA